MTADDTGPGRAMSAERGEDPVRRIFDAHGGRVRAIALHFFGGDASAADDIVQQVFIKVHDRLHQFRGDAALGTWLHRVVVNTCLDHRRSRRRLVPLEDVSPALACDDAASPERAAGREQARARVREAVAGLPPKLRIAVLLRHFEDLSYDEMATALGCSPGTVASRLNRGHAALARALAPSAEA